MRITFASGLNGAAFGLLVALGVSQLAILCLMS